jgi:hypothetical protein
MTRLLYRVFNDATLIIALKHGFCIWMCELEYLTVVVLHLESVGLSAHAVPSGRASL